MQIFLHGFAFGGALIMAIGAQNLFVLRQGMLRQNQWMVAITCSISDMVLIFTGSTGVGSMIASNVYVQNYAAIGGGLFLVWMGIGALREGLGQIPEPAIAARNRTSRGKIFVMTLALTYLNPHVYLDTVLLLGTVGGQYSFEARGVFAAGASLASWTWFFALTTCGVMFGPYMTRPVIWKIINMLVAVTMLSLAWGLLTSVDLSG